MEAVTSSAMGEVEVGAMRDEAWDDPSRWVELFHELADGRSEALAPLYDMASARLFGLAAWRTGSRETAAEVVQDVFVRVALQREKLGGIRDPRWWLLSVTDHLAMDAVRRAGLRQVERLEDHADLPGEDTDHPRAVDARRAWALLDRIPAKQRAVIYLHHAAGMSHAEIGRCLGIPAFTAASRYRLGIAALRKLLGSTR
jgi:RNA polymerase sigma-70 factor (ECF subfamily)